LIQICWIIDLDKIYLKIYHYNIVTSVVLMVVGFMMTTRTFV